MLVVFVVAVIKLGVNTESLRIHHSTAARHSWNGLSDVTRLVTTEQVRNKYSLLESIFLKQISQATLALIEK